MTSARARSRRSTTSKRPGTGCVNFGWDVYEGRASFEDKALGPGRLVQPVAEYGRTAAAPSRAATSIAARPFPRISGRYFFGDYCSGNVWSVSSGGGGMRLESVRLPGLSSFGEGLRGELYAVAHGGTIHRFAR